MQRTTVGSSGQDSKADSGCAAQSNQIGRVRSRNVLCPALFKLHNKRRNACNYVVSGDIRIAGREELVKFVIKDHTFQASFFDMTISQRAPKSSLLG
jgi:hypothetical protein